MSDDLDSIPSAFQPDPLDQPEHACAFPGRCILDGRDHDATECRVRDEDIDLPPAGDEDAQIPPPEEFWKHPRTGRVDVEVFYRDNVLRLNPNHVRSRVYPNVRLYGSTDALAEATQYIADHVGTRDLTHLRLFNFVPHEKASR